MILLQTEREREKQVGMFGKEPSEAGVKASLLGSWGPTKSG